MGIKDLINERKFRFAARLTSVKLVAMATSTLLTIDDFERLPGEVAENHELVEGALVDVSGNTPRHNKLRDRPKQRYSISTGVCSVLSLTSPLRLHRRRTHMKGSLRRKNAI